VIVKGSCSARHRKPLLHWLRVPVLILSTFLTVTFCIAQTPPSDNPSRKQKFDEYGDLGTDDEAAHLDRLAEQLLKEPNLRGCILGYREPHMKPGVYLRRIFGIGRYLSESRGVEPSRIMVVDGG
jgi:hypothetical protein